MRQIKFRGRTNDGRTFYGDLHHVTENHVVIIDKYGLHHPVNAESVAQMVGYDIDVREVYEGDILVDFYGNEYTAQLHAMGLNDDDCIALTDSGKLNLKVKEARDEAD